MKQMLAVGAVVVASMCGGACGDDDDSDAVDATEACDRLEVVGNAILDVRDADSLDEVRESVEPAMDAFVDAAEGSGDEQLEEQATTAAERFDVYLTGDGIDAREAGNDADIALDRAIERCIEVGATNDFPQEPDS